ncbi:MAG: nuclear transport factor 2 family protein, partial [Conexibacter sp.]
MSPAAKSKTTETVARRYFEAVAARDVEAMVACWQPGSIDRLHGQADLIAPDGVRAWFTELFAALPDTTFEVLSTTAQDDRCAVRWRMRGTFAGPGTFQGFEPTGARIDVEGCDVVTVADGLLVANEAYTDGMTIARQIGALPPRDSGVERRLTAAANVRARLVRRLLASEPEQIAEGVWV